MEIFSSPHTIEQETALILMSQQGDGRAFAELMVPYENMLKQQCYKLRIDESSTEDVTQEILIQVFKNIKKFEGRSKFSTWLYRISRNTALNFIRKRSRLKENSYKEELATENVFLETHLKDAALVKDESFQLIGEAVETLSERHQIVFKMYEYEHIPQREIAQVLRLKEGTVRSRLHYARKKIKSYLIQKQRKSL